MRMALKVSEYWFGRTSVRVNAVPGGELEDRGLCYSLVVRAL